MHEDTEGFLSFLEALSNGSSFKINDEERQNRNDESAKEIYNMYTSYVKAGFTPEQAMEILIELFRIIMGR